MSYLLVLDKNLIIAIVAFLVCFIIGFIGDLYMRKNKKIGSLIDTRVKNSKVNKESNSNIISNEAPKQIKQNLTNNNNATLYPENMNNDDQINNLF